MPLKEKQEMRNLKWTQREVSKNIVLEFRTFVLKNRVSTFWYQYKNEMVRREKLNWVYLTTFWLRTELIVYLYIKCTANSTWFEQNKNVFNSDENVRIFSVNLCKISILLPQTQYNTQVHLAISSILIRFSENGIFPQGHRSRSNCDFGEN